MKLQKIEASSLATLKEENKLMMYYPEPALKASFAELIHQILEVKQRDTTPEKSALIIEACYDKHDPIGLFAKAIIGLMKAKTFGDPIATLNEILAQEREALAIERENQHYKTKGFGSEEVRVDEARILKKP